MKVGVISDTHNFLDPHILKMFHGVGHILHAGDIGQPAILDQLRQIAPVTAVAGNTDDPMFGYSLSETVELGGLRFLVQHIVNPRLPGDDLRSRINATRPQVVVFGHTHSPFDAEVEGIRFLNPGCAGKKRFSLPRSVAMLHLRDRKMTVEMLPL